MALAGSPEGVEGGGGRTWVCPTRLTDSPVCENSCAGSSLGGFGSRLISDLSRVQLPPAQLQLSCRFAHEELLVSGFRPA